MHHFDIHFIVHTHKVCRETRTLFVCSALLVTATLWSITYTLQGWLICCSVKSALQMRMKYIQYHRIVQQNCVEEERRKRSCAVCTFRWNEWIGKSTRIFFRNTLSIANTHTDKNHHLYRYKCEFWVKMHWIFFALPPQKVWPMVAFDILEKWSIFIRKTTHTPTHAQRFVC